MNTYVLYTKFLNFNVKLTPFNKLSRLINLALLLFIFFV